MKRILLTTLMAGLLLLLVVLVSPALLYRSPLVVIAILMAFWTMTYISQEL